MTEPAAARRPSRGALALAGAAVVAIVVVIADAWATGAHRLPYSDDWAYLRIQDHLDHTGHFVGYGWNDVSLFGQVQVARLLDVVLDDSVLASRLVVIASGILAAVLVVWLVRRSRRPDLWPLALLSFVALPSTLNVLVTSMTDLPSTLLMLACLAAGFAAVRGDGSARSMALGPLVLAAVCGVAAITVRQTAAAAPIAVFGCLLLVPQTRRSRRVVLAVGVAAAAVALAFLAWRSGIDRSAPNAHLTLARSTGVLVRTWSLLGLGAAPVVLASGVTGAWWRAARDVSRRPTARAALLGVPVVWFVGATAVGWRQPVIPTVLVREGPVGTASLSTLSGAQSNLVWHFVAVCAAAGGALLLAVTLTAVIVGVERHGARAIVRLAGAHPALSIVVAFILLSFAVDVASSYLQHAVWDRYLIPVLVAVVLLVCRASSSLRASRAAAVGGAAIALVLAVAAVWSVTDWNSFQSARFDGAALAARAGVPEANIDAGFEYVGIHGATATPMVLETDQSYLDVFHDFRRCAFVGADDRPPAGMHEIGQVRYKAAFGLVRRTIHVFAVDRC